MITITQSDVAEMTVNELVRLQPQTLGLFKMYGIDACCGGGAKISDAAVRHGIEADTLLKELHAVIVNTR